MNTPTKKITYDEIDQLVESFNKDWIKEINWEFVTEEKMESLLKTI